MVDTFIAQHILTTPDATSHLARQFAHELRAGDVLLLEGDIGAGKSHFARSVIRARQPDVGDIPSPTFTLVQTYEGSDFDIWHCDLYRLTHPDEAIELGLLEAFETSVCLIEWPDRLGEDRPEDALTLRFQAGEAHHSVEIRASAAQWRQRIGDLNV